MIGRTNLMPNQRQLASTSFENGYKSSRPITGNWDGSAYRGLNFFFRANGRGEVWNGVSQTSATAVGARIYPLDAFRGEIAGGLVSSRPPRAGLCRYRLAALFYLSEYASQQVYINESTTTPFVLTGIVTSPTPYKLRVAIPDATGLIYTGYDAGLPAPIDVIVVSQLSPGTKSMTGSYSLLVSRKRLTTQTLSNPSPVNVQTISAGTTAEFLVTLPALIAGQDAWIIGGSQKGFGLTGPWFQIREVKATGTGTVDPDGTTTVNATVGSVTHFLDEISPGDVITINAVSYTVATVVSDTQFTTTGAVAIGVAQTVTPTQVAVEWFNAELGPIIEFDNDLAPLAAGIFSFNDILFLWGTYGAGNSPPGPGISPAKPNNPEAFPILATVYTADAEDILNVYPAEGRIYVTTKNTLQVLTFTGADSPLLARPIWKFGFSTATAGVVADQSFYGFSSKGACRTTAQDGPDFIFAADVQHDMSGWTASRVVLGFDPKNQCVCYMHYDGSTNTTILPFMLNMQRWSTPLYVAGQVVDATTVNGTLYLVVLSGGIYTVYEFDATGGTITGTPYLATPYSDAQAEGVDKALTRLSITGYAATARVYINNSDVTDASITSPAVYNHDLQDFSERPEPTLRLNVRQAKLFSVRIDCDAVAGRSVDEVTVWGSLNLITR